MDLWPRGLAADRTISLVACKIDGTVEDMHPLEAAGLGESAATSRRREFAAGRYCARVAMRHLGHAGGPVTVAGDRSPIWPDGAIGSISHSGILAGAAVALDRSGMRSIGLDIEPASPLECDLIAEICVEDEMSWLSSRPAAEQPLLAKAIFCAKEAAYKSQYPLSRQLTGFDTLQIDLDIDAGSFVARCLSDALPFRSGDMLRGSIWLTHGHFISVATVR